MDQEYERLVSEMREQLEEEGRLARRIAEAEEVRSKLHEQRTILRKRRKLINNTMGLMVSEGLPLIQARMVALEVANSTRARTSASIWVLDDAQRIKEVARPLSRWERWICWLFQRLGGSGQVLDRYDGWYDDDEESVDEDV